MVRFSQKFTGDLWGQFQKRNASTCQAERVEESEAVPGGERVCGQSVWASGGARPRPPHPLEMLASRVRKAELRGSSFQWKVFLEETSAYLKKERMELVKRKVFEMQEIPKVRKAGLVLPSRHFNAGLSHRGPPDAPMLCWALLGRLARSNRFSSIIELIPVYHPFCV